MEKIERANAACEVILRFLSMAIGFAALVVMAMNSVSNEFGSLSYSSLGAFKYLVHVNGICAAYSLLAAPVVAFLRPISMTRAWTFFILDQVFTYVVLGAMVGSAQVLSLAYKGNSYITWSSACDSYGVFCHKALVSTLITFVVVVLYMLLSLISSYTLFSRFDSPRTQNCGLRTADTASKN